MSKQSIKHKQRQANKHKHKQALSQQHYLNLSLHNLKNTVQIKTPGENEYLKEYDIDLDIKDSGETVYSEERTEDPVCLTKELLDLKENYILTIGQLETEEYYCYFEPPRWMTSRVGKEYKEVLNGMIRIIIKIADTVETSYQLLLANPTNELPFLQNKLTQKSFVSQLNSGEELLTEGDFSKLKNKVWLVWDDKCMSLAVIFKNTKKGAKNV